MFKAVIIEDENHCIDSLKYLLEPYNNRISLVGTCGTVNGAIDLIKKVTPDLIFLDVHLGKSTGFDLLNSFDALFFDVIFTTAFERHAVQAFKYSAIDYLLKPIDKKDFESALERWFRKEASDSMEKRKALLLNTIESKEYRPSKIAVPTQHGFEFLKLNDIAYCEADVNYTTIFYQNKRLTVAKTLKYFDEILSDKNFYRVHKSYLINLDYVEKYFKGNGGYVLMNNGRSIQISQRRKEAFLKKINGH